MAIDSFKYLSPTSTTIARMLIARSSRVTEPIPWAPLRTDLSEATVALVSTAALSMKSDLGFDTEGERANPWWGDPSYRIIPQSATSQDIVASHLHIETSYLLEDLDVALPLRRLDELSQIGFVGQSAPSHYSFQGYLLDPAEFLASSVPALVAQMKREAVDVAVFVPV
jgi:D-proline reductase (dithiol) PrdB